MTINVGVVTSEALVLGCDSIASSTGHLLNPFKLDVKEDKKTGEFSVRFKYADLDQTVLAAWGGVTKMFSLQEKNIQVAALTAGIARLNDRTMNSYAKEFKNKQDSRGKPRASVEVVAKDFLTFMKKEYLRHYDGSTVPKEFWEGPEFLVGGFGKQAQFPSLFRVKVKEGEVHTEYKAGDTGISWAGQADAVARLIFGYDPPLKFKIEDNINTRLEGYRESMSKRVVEILEEAMKKSGTTLPEDIDTELPIIPTLNLPWDDYRINIMIGNLPIQDAIDFTAHLVNLQSGKDKFAYGVATVGGRTHIGLLTKHEGFSMIDEPDLIHRNIGFVPDV